MIAVGECCGASVALETYCANCGTRVATIDPLSPADRERMARWLADRAKDPHKHLHYTGSNETVADLERWILALNQTPQSR